MMRIKKPNQESVLFQDSTEVLRERTAVPLHQQTVVDERALYLLQKHGQVRHVPALTSLDVGYQR